MRKGWSLKWKRSQTNTRAHPKLLVKGTAEMTRAGESRAPAPPQGGKPATGKKLTMKPLKKQPALSHDFLQSVWTKEFLPAVVAVQQSRFSGISFERLYSRVEDVCAHKLGAGLYQFLRDQCDSHVRELFDGIGASLLEGTEFLEFVNRVWGEHCSQMLIIRSIFLYLDRTYVLSSASSALSVWDMGLRLWWAHLKSCPTAVRKTLNGALDLVRAERQNAVPASTGRALLKSIVRMLSAIGMYEEYFEPLNLSKAYEFYRQEGSTMFTQCTVAKYLEHTERRIHEEAERCDAFLESSSKKPLLQAVERMMIAAMIDELLQEGFNELCAQRRFDDLRRMYSLFARVNDLDTAWGTSSCQYLGIHGSAMPSSWKPCSQTAHEKLRRAFVAYMKNVGTDIVMDEQKDAEMVSRLLEFKRDVDIMLSQAFMSNEGFVIAAREAFEACVNMRQNKPAELIAKFVDQILRTGNKSYTEEELESTLDSIMILFRYIQGKDIFEAFFKKDLAKRLLFQKSASLELEKQMISRMKTECGAPFTNKLEGMFRDVDLSADILNAFQAYRNSRSSAAREIDLNVYILTNSYWPQLSTALEIKLPREISNMHEEFKQFYLEKHQGKQLAWQHSSGSCTLRAHFAKGSKLIDVSLFQAVVCMLFNKATVLSYQEILDATGLDPKELKRVLLSLACGKVTTRVILKEPKGAELGENDRFVFNEQFTHKMMKIKINSIQLKETPEENKDTTEKVFQDRQYQIDAAIVRVMKTRKVATHTNLLTELYSILKFPHKPADLKKRIESLIEREYLERDPSNPQMYKYLA
ncbi:Cullin-4 [Porphyridium purpureum]|uniref:Cullin-4 n=1 Tax=Porphyridium purpureum TaxID=35688 RepID=A0A5J4YT14_PORPP|nr:Cullin-4 [Porphyridium purpureum]|eukprot:POR9410..scf229_5